MHSWLNTIVITSPFVATGIQLVLLIGSICVAWPLWAALFPESWIGVPLSKSFGFVLMGLRMLARSSMGQQLVRLKPWVIVVLVRTFFNRSWDRRSLQRAGFLDT